MTRGLGGRTNLVEDGAVLQSTDFEVLHEIHAGAEARHVVDRARHAVDVVAEALQGAGGEVCRGGCGGHEAGDEELHELHLDDNDSRNEFVW